MASGKRYPATHRENGGELPEWIMDRLLGWEQPDSVYAARHGTQFSVWWEWFEPGRSILQDRARYLPQVVEERRRRGLPYPSLLEWEMSPAHDSGSDWELVKSILHGTELPAWARDAWTPDRMAARRRELEARLRARTPDPDA
jgi:hypothetical protein